GNMYFGFGGHGGQKDSTIESSTFGGPGLSSRCNRVSDWPRLVPGEGDCRTMGRLRRGRRLSRSCDFQFMAICRTAQPGNNDESWGAGPDERFNDRIFLAAGLCQRWACLT
ncbi:unnamed protein product, partial [Nesidiocoris tenuis]